MREWLHVFFLRESGKRVSLDPRPRADVRDRVLASTIACQKVFFLTGVFAAQVNLQHAVHTERLIPEAINCIGNLLFCELGEVVHLTCCAPGVSDCYTKRSDPKIRSSGRARDARNKISGYLDMVRRSRARKTAIARLENARARP